MFNFSIFEYTMKHRDKVIRGFVSAILLLAILIIQGCFDFISLKFDFQQIALLSFWGKVAYKLMLLLFIRSLAMIMFQQIARVSNHTLHFEMEKNERLMMYKDAQFPVWIENIKNKEIKISAWKTKIHNKLATLEKWSLAKSRALYFSTNPEDEIKKQKSRYCRKRAMYEQYLNDEWIKENYYSLNIVNYEKINPADFDCPVFVYSGRSIYQMKSKTKTAMATTLLTSTILLIAGQILINAIGYDFDKETLEAGVAAGVIAFISDIIFIGWQFLNGVYSAFKIVNNEEVVPYVNRNRVLTEYCYYKTPEANRDKLAEMLELLKQEADNKAKAKEKENKEKEKEA